MKLGITKTIISKIRGCKIEDLLQILLVATVVLVILTFTNPNFMAPKYGIGGPPLYAYFDVFVRFGTFIFIYFTLIPVFVVWLVKKGLKKGWRPKTGLLSFIATLFVLALVFAVVPGPIYGNPFSIPWADIYGPRTFENENEFCGNRIDFFYSPTCCGRDELKPEILDIKNELELRGSDVKVYIWCRSVNESACEEYVRGEYGPTDVQNLLKEYNFGLMPGLVLGCRYVAQGQFEIEDYKELICEKLNECGL